MSSIEPFACSAKHWRFLSKPERYLEASTRSGRRLVLESTRRQFLTASDILRRLTGSNGEVAHRGILLADDVGLGKTTVAALVAWVVASAGEKGVVRILAPNDVIMRRWVDELHSHVGPLQECAPHLDARQSRIKVGRIGRLKAGSIQVVKHSYAASDLRLACDLLIVDEAHRAKGEHSAFSVALKKQKRHARRVLILTATPFSIRLEELQRMLTLVGGEAAHAPVRSFSRALNDIYSGNTARSPEEAAQRLAARARAAVEALSSCVIRHGIDDLPNEQRDFGGCEDWTINVPAAGPQELELLLRMDRALRVAQVEGFKSSWSASDPRFHVGWQHFDTVRGSLQRDVPQFAEPARSIVERHLEVMKELRSRVGVHSKMVAVADKVKTTLEQGEKVVLFCHHIATAQELTVHLSKVLPKVAASHLPSRSIWEQAWKTVLKPAGEDRREESLRGTFIDWLCSDLNRAQTWNGLRAAAPSISGARLVSALKSVRARSSLNQETFAEAAQGLYHALIQSKSSRAVLKAAADRPELLPGANSHSRVLGVCPATAREEERLIFLLNKEPDTAISIFNSPFGPEVLVVTDRLSEGIDLHRYCRHLIHYELDPSPIRTVQRNGRLRRVNSWAAVAVQPIRYAYPAFCGTRDHRLVQIMKKRIASFSLLLGGVKDFEVEEVIGSEEEWRNRVIALAKGCLTATNGQLRARDIAEG